MITTPYNIEAIAEELKDSWEREFDSVSNIDFWREQVKMFLDGKRGVEMHDFTLVRLSGITL